MKVIVGFEELSGEIKGRFNQEVTFEHVSDTEVKVTYRKKVMLVSVPVSVNLTVADVSGESVSLRYHMMAGVDQLISWVLKSVSGRIPELKDALRIDGDTCSIDLSEVKGAKSFTENFMIRDIRFMEKGIEADLCFRHNRGCHAEIKRMLDELVDEIDVEETREQPEKVVKLELAEAAAGDAKDGANEKVWLSKFKQTLRKFAEKYTPAGLMEKLKKSGKDMGVKLVYYVLLLYYSLLDGKVPLKDKLIVVAALGYVISPLDFIPDFVVAGFLDDMSIVAFALHRIKSNVTPEVERQALSKLQEWFKVDSAPKMEF